MQVRDQFCYLVELQDQRNCTFIKMEELRKFLLQKNCKWDNNGTKDTIFIIPKLNSLIFLLEMAFAILP